MSGKPNNATTLGNARRLAADGKTDQARRAYRKLLEHQPDHELRAAIKNDMGVLSALEGELAVARAGFEESLQSDPTCEAARLNLAMFVADEATSAIDRTALLGRSVPNRSERTTRIAVLSFLFNWPSTGGGNVHTYELVRALRSFGFEVRHMFARNESVGIGRIEGALPEGSVPLPIVDTDWNIPAIQASFRRAVDDFNPDFTIITDSWNIKPLLADAVSHRPYLLRMQAMECICPLNNVRLLPDPPSGFRQCRRNQFDHPLECGNCVTENARFSGSLHTAERDLCGVGSPEYRDSLLRAFRGASATLAVNPLTAAALGPYGKRIPVAPSGFDPARFPWDGPPPRRPAGAPGRILFAGLVDETIKGFHVLAEACRILLQRRNDFEVIATAERSARIGEFVRCIGWQSQETLPQQLRDADICVLPTIAQEALGRTAVEAMGAWRPVVAARIGGLPGTVVEGVTGLLFEPGNAADLAARLETLLDDPERARAMGVAGRRRFDEHFTWESIIRRHYLPILGTPVSRRRPA